MTELVLRELTENHDIEDAVFLVDDAQHLQTALRRHGLRFRYEKQGNRTAVERVFREIRRRSSSVSNCFSHVCRPITNSWLQAVAVWQTATN
ncbi:transposase [Natrinema pallidum DSM 3751]|uniref:Transposase n=1 Tax=Natrinema pallidum DSM 3751 TaxID=1227495 RepID=L9YMJ2_9EURY|nr:transposase [Natrinema pallidum DSM 3751]